MRKCMIVIFCLVLFFSFVYGVQGKTIISEDIRFKKFMEHNIHVYGELIDDIISITKRIVSSKYDLDDKIIFRKVQKAKIRLYRKLSKQIEINIRTGQAFDYDHNIAIHVKCRSCNGDGCEACGNDGYGWSPGTEEPPACGKCGGDGEYAGGECPGCSGLGWANTKAD